MSARAVIFCLTGLLLAFAPLGTISLAQQPEAEQLQFTNAAQLRQLSAERAARAFSARLQGVVITEREFLFQIPQV